MVIMGVMSTKKVQTTKVTVLFFIRNSRINITLNLVPKDTHKLSIEGI
jgi:hypothetical protein